ncbi:hypothetical protein IQ255_07670 [Pleurocapsales cyanobacterium LEGE 10410]|nr:hypothetical protein [Pleurocapsales cyanobacterium LEGE 10410]
MLRLEFWLPLPLVGLAFWSISGLITEHNLTQGDRNIESLIIAPNQAQPASNILSIKVIVDRDRQLSQVRVKQTTQVNRYQQFELDTTEIKDLEQAIASRLNLSSKQVKQLLRYQMVK